MDKSLSLTDRISERFLGAELQKRMRSALAAANVHNEPGFEIPDNSRYFMLWGRYVPTLADTACISVGVGGAYFGIESAALTGLVAIVGVEGYRNIFTLFAEKYIKKLEKDAYLAEIRQKRKNARADPVERVAEIAESGAGQESGVVSDFYIDRSGEDGWLR